MAGASEVVHKLSVSDEALTVIADAIRDLTIARKKIQSFNDLIAEGLISPQVDDTVVLAAFAALRPAVGKTEIYLRLSASLNNELRHTGARLTIATGQRCTARETVLFCALQITQRKLTLANQTSA